MAHKNMKPYISFNSILGLHVTVWISVSLHGLGVENVDASWWTNSILFKWRLHESASLISIDEFMAELSIGRQEFLEEVDPWDVSFFPPCLFLPFPPPLLLLSLLPSSSCLSLLPISHEMSDFTPHISISRRPSSSQSTSNLSNHEPNSENWIPINLSFVFYVFFFFFTAKEAD